MFRFTTCQASGFNWCNIEKLFTESPNAFTVTRMFRHMDFFFRIIIEYEIKLNTLSDRASEVTRRRTGQLKTVVDLPNETFVQIKKQS